MMQRFGWLVAFPLALACLTIGSGRMSRAAEPGKKAEAAAPAPKPVSPVSVNVIVNVRVSHDTKVDVRIDAPFTPVVGSLQLPDFVQRMVGSLFKTPDAPATKPGPDGNPSTGKSTK
jgi:hypothetical protein